MAILPILEYPDPRLRTRAAPITVFDARLARLVDDMFQTMYEAPGIGLAASQVDVHQRLIVIDVSKDRSAPLVFINPEIVTREGVWMNEEGCLSVPGVFEEVERAEIITVCARRVDGSSFEMRLDGLTAICLQHEMDHLEGKLFVDYLSDIKRERIRRKLDKDRKERKERAGRPAPQSTARDRTPVI